MRYECLMAAGPLLVLTKLGQVMLLLLLVLLLLLLLLCYCCCCFFCLLLLHWHILSKSSCCCYLHAKRFAAEVDKWIYFDFIAKNRWGLLPCLPPSPFLPLTLYLSIWMSECMPRPLQPTHTFVHARSRCGQRLCHWLIKLHKFQMLQRFSRCLSLSLSLPLSLFVYGKPKLHLKLNAAAESQSDSKQS